MKKIVGISLFIFCAAVAAVIIVGLFIYPKNPVKPDPFSLLPSGGGAITLNAQEIGKHNSQSDCWMVINSKVYNFTSYLGAHPGGAASMVSYCGADGTQAFITKDQKNARSHSSYADSLLANYYLGDLNQIVDSQAVQQNVKNTNNSPAPASGRGGDDGEYDD